MVEVICDTSFLIHLATKRIKNIDSLDAEIGTINFVVPKVVKNELKNLLQNPEKQFEISKTLDYIKKFKIISISGNFADKELIDYISKNHAIIATMDKELKKQIRMHGSSTITIHNNKILFET